MIRKLLAMSLLGPAIVLGVLRFALTQEKDFKYMTPAEQQAYWKKFEREFRKAQGPQHHPEHDVEKTVILNGNKITTSLYNYGSISRPGECVVDLQWEGLGYGYEFGPLVAAAVKDTAGRTVHIVDDGFILQADGDYAPGTAEKWGWLPKLGYSDSRSPEIATFNAPDKDPPDGKPDSWPESWYNPVLSRYVWPAFLGDDATTPDEEAYFVMDDLSNAEFAYFPFPDDSVKRGLGLEMQVRVFQFNNPLAEDIIFLVYTVTNVSPKDIDTVYFGMFGDPHVGGCQDYSDDNAGFIGPFDTDFPFQSRNMVYAYDQDGVGQGGRPTGYFGYKFLESPSIHDDGIDNDGDGLIDESPFNEAGEYLYGPVGIYGPAKFHWSGDEDGDWNPEFDDVGRDGIPGTGDFGEGNGKPDQGEPNFGFKDIAESDQLGLTSFHALAYGGNNRPKNDELMWQKITTPLLEAEIEQEQDNVFIYGSGPFHLKSGESQRFSIALLMGRDIKDLVQNAEIAQQVFEADYRFAKPPDKPHLTVVPGDGKVTLYWDTAAEESFDPFVARGHPENPSLGYDFEGYKIYRSTDYTFEDTKTITDAAGIPFLSEPLRDHRGRAAQWDLVNEYEGLSKVEYRGRGVRYQLGSNSGLAHAYVDSNNVINGKTYFYALVAYDHGDEGLGISPTETQRIIKRDKITGQFTFDVNTAMVVPGPPAAGYVPPTVVGEGRLAQRIAGDATGEVRVDILDPLKVKPDKEYDVTFSTLTDSAGRSRVVYSVQDLQPVTQPFVARDTVFARVPARFLVPGSVTITDPSGNPVNPADYEIDYTAGRIRGRRPNVLPNGQTFRITYQSFPVYQSGYLNNEDFNPTFDGLRVFVRDDPNVLDPSRSGWKVLNTPTNLRYQVRMSTSPEAAPYPGDFELHFTNYDTTTDGKLAAPADTALAPNPRVPGVHLPFRTYLTSTGERVKVFVNESDPKTRNGRWDYSERIVIMRPQFTKVTQTTYQIEFSVPVDSATMKPQKPIYPRQGDIFLVFSKKPFEAGDQYHFKTQAAVFDKQLARSVLDKVYVVPNPYIAYGEGEIASPRPGERDQRRLEFRNLPRECTIRIYTMVGELVAEIHKNDDRDYAVWNLLTLEAQTLAYGIYLYHIDAPGIGQKLGRFAVIK